MRRLTVLLALAFTLALVPAMPAQAKKPLGGEMSLFFTGPANPLWTGTISGDINGNMYFNSTASKDVGQAHHFWEFWWINGTDGDGIWWINGTDKGVVSWKNMKYRMNGVVTGASEDYEHLIGRKVHMSGDIIWPDYPTPPPEEAPGTFRIN